MTKLPIAISLALCFSAAVVAAPQTEKAQRGMPIAERGTAPESSPQGTVLVTHGKAGGRHSATLDLQSDGSATALQFLLQLPKNATSIDTSSCLSGLPKGFTGRCVAGDAGKVAVVVYTTGDATLPAGMVGIGEVSFAGKGKAEVAVNQIEVASRDGRVLSTTSKVVPIE